MNELIRETVSSVSVGGAGPWQADGLGNQWAPNPLPSYPYAALVPRTECAGDTHVFPCARCNTCQCGKATVQR